MGCSTQYKEHQPYKKIFYCPCHGSKFDLAGRVLKGSPAPRNLEVPPYKFIDEHTILIGKHQKSWAENNISLWKTQTKQHQNPPNNLEAGFSVRLFIIFHDSGTGLCSIAITKTDDPTTGTTRKNFSEKPKIDLLALN